MRQLILTTALAVLFSSPAFAETLKPYSPACATQDLLEQMHDAALRQDMHALDWLSRNGCAMNTEPVQVTVLGLSSWGGYAHVRAYRGKHSAEVWTDRAAVDGYDPLNP
jgi:hypothetical protein